MNEQITDARNERPLMFITNGGRVRRYLVTELPNGRLSIVNDDGSALRHYTAAANIIRYFGGTKAVLDFCRLSESEQLATLQSPAHVQERQEARRLSILKREQRRSQQIEADLTYTPSENPRHRHNMNPLEKPDAR